MKTHKVLVLVVAAMTSLAGCGGLSDVGEQETAKTPPGAVVTVIGHASTVSGDKTTLTVRAGGEVLLSGKDSTETVLPILAFDWQMLNDAARQLKVVQRSNSTIAFQVPQTSGGTGQELQLRLVVTDSDGRSDQHDVTVNVEPIADTNQFLTYLGAASTFTVVAVATTDLPPCPAATACLASDVPFEIEVEARANYWDIGGNFNTGETGSNPSVVVDARKVSGSWSQTMGASADCGALENPAYQMPIPQFDADDIAAAVQKNSATRVVDTSRMDDAYLTITVRISQPAGSAATLPAGSRAVCVSELNGAPAAFAGRLPHGKSRLPMQQATDGTTSTATFTDRELLAAVATPPDGNGGAVPFDTFASAAAYYKTIDIEADALQKQSFLGWLKFNGFLAQSATSIDWPALASGADAHALYVNNFDLGFGRDMYARRVKCAPGTGPNFSPGDCSVATVVVNYGSLEAAAKKLAPQLAVAMEYSQKGDTGPRFVKFYTYAPDTRCNPAAATSCSQFRLVKSANLDGRGEKFLPGACTICHGGAPLGHTGDVYAGGGDVNASFLPWDQKSLLFSDNPQAGFPDDPANATHHQLWLQARESEQAPRIKNLNAIAALTYVDPPGQERRHELSRELVQGLYSGPGGTFNPNFVPAQWGVDQSHADLYLNVFAQNCRMCHVAQVPNPSATAGAPGLDPFDKCDAQSASAPYLGRNHQIAFGCHQQFVNMARLPARVAASVMPNARLTLDRFWSGGDQSAANALARHLDRDVSALRPQTSVALDLVDVAEIRGGAAEPVAFAEDGSVRIDNRGALVRLLGAVEGLSSSVAWTVNAPNGSPVSLAGSTSPTPSFVAATPGRYSIQLAAGGQTVDRSISVTDWVPVAVADTVPASPNATVSIAILENDKVRRVDDPLTAAINLLEGGVEQGDGPHDVELCNAQAQCSRDPVLTENGGRFQFDPADGNVLSYVAANAAFSYTDEVTYRVTDEDGQLSQATVTVNVTAQLTAGPRCVRVSSRTNAESLAPANSFTLPIAGGTEDNEVTFAQALAGLSAGASLYGYVFDPLAQNDSENEEFKIFTGSLATDYTVSDGVQPPATNNLTIRVAPQQPWLVSTPNTGIAALIATIQTQCTGCHGAGLPLDLSGNINNDYTELTSTTVPLGSVIDTDDPENSLLLRCPVVGGDCQLGNHMNNGSRFITNPSTQYSQLLRWIEEGARQNNSTDPDYNCP